MSNINLIIAGSRAFTDKQLAFKVLNKLKEYFQLRDQSITNVICGMARGADLLGYDWALTNNIPIIKCSANWTKYGKKAGFIRNKEMAELGNYLLAFWDGESRGTKIMIDLMEQAGKEYFVYLYKK